MKFSLSFTIVIVLLLAGNQALAQQQEPGTHTTTSTQHTQPQRLVPQPAITLAGQIELARLVDLAAQRLKLNIEYDAQVLKGVVTLRLDAGLTDDELWQLVNRVLATRGFTTVRTPGNMAYSVVKLADAAGFAQPILTETAEISKPSTAAQSQQNGESAPGEQASADANKTPDARPFTDVPAETALEPQPGYLTVVVRAKHRSTKDLADQLNKVISKTNNSATPIGDTGLLMISDLSSRVDRAFELLKILDTPASRTTVEQVSIQNIGASQMVTLVSQVAAKRDAVSGEKMPGEVLAGPDGDSVLIIAQESQLAYWKQLIADLDKREEVRTATYTPRYFSAADVGRLIDQTIRDPADTRWKIIDDTLTASLIITATPTQHIAIEDLMHRLESVPAASRRPVRSFVIKNRNVNEVRKILEDLLHTGVLAAGADVAAGTGSEIRGSDTLSASAGTSSDSASTSNTGDRSSITTLPPPPTTHGPGSSVRNYTSTSGLSSSPRTTSSSTTGSRSESLVSPSLSTYQYASTANDPLIFAVDEGTNTLIAIGEPRLLTQVEALLKTLDVRQPQVMLEVLMVTLNDSQSLSLGVELEQIQISNDVRIRLSSLFGLGNRGGTGGDRLPPLSASGFTGSILSPGEFSLIIRALESLNKGRSISMPKLLVGNNQQASINSTLQQPFASVNASNTVSTTSFGGTQDAGTVVSISPQIAEGDHLTLTYSVSLSAFVGTSSDPSLPPPRQQNQVQSIATIPDGHVIVVGGIEIESQSNSTTQVPIFGSLPIIGEAFKSRSNSTTRSKFFVFIRANVLRGRGFDDLKYFSAKDAATAKISDDYPVVRPQIIR